MNILSLMKKEVVCTPYHLDAEEVVVRPQVLDDELGAKALGEPSKEVDGACSQDDVVDVEKQIGRRSAVGVDEPRGI